MLRRNVYLCNDKAVPSESGLCKCVMVCDDRCLNRVARIACIGEGRATAAQAKGKGKGKGKGNKKKGGKQKAKQGEAAVAKPVKVGKFDTCAVGPQCTNRAIQLRESPSLQPFRVRIASHV